MRFEFFVAARYLKAKRRQAVVGVVTAISIAGVTAGVAALIIALAITNGMRRDMQDRLIDSSAHVQLMRTNQNEGIRDWRPLLARLSKLPHVVAAAPELDEQVVVAHGAREGYALIEGIIPEYEKSVSKILASAPPSAVKALEPPNQPADSSAPRELPPLILGNDLAASVGASEGDTVKLISPQGELTPFGIVPKYARFKVVGIFSSGFYDYDNTWAFIRLSDAQRLFDLNDVVSVLEFKVHDIYKAAEIGRQLEAAAGKGFMSTNWMEQNRALFRALRLERVVTFITIGLIVFVAALNILISLIMMVTEKTRDIAVLVSMGAKKRQVRRIFMFQGVLIGVIGTAIGLVLGYSISWAAGHYHLLSLSAEVYSIDYVPFAPRFGDALLVSIVAIGISFVATLYPSWSAAGVLPAEALRYE